jgi:hypothetical protein
MASLKQIEANRRNAQLSTGPTSAAGKAVSCMNALKTGIQAKSQVIRGEDPAALELLTEEYYERFPPQGPDERDVLDAIISNVWLLRRLRNTEAEIWNSQMYWDTKHGETDYLQARAYGASETIDRCHSRMAAVERSLRTNLETLHRLRKQRLAEPEPQPEIPEPAEQPEAKPQTPPIPDPRSPIPGSPSPQSSAPGPESPTPAPGS